MELELPIVQAREPSVLSFCFRDSERKSWCTRAHVYITSFQPDPEALERRTYALTLEFNTRAHAHGEFLPGALTFSSWSCVFLFFASPLRHHVHIVPG